MSNHHSRRAFELLSALPNDFHRMESIEIGSAATAHALLAIEERLGQLVEQQRLANVVAAFDAGIEADGHALEMGSVDIHAAIVYLQGRIIEIVNPESEKR